MTSLLPGALILFAVGAAIPIRGAPASDADRVIAVLTPMPAPEWARLERRLLAENVPACREFFERYYDSRGFLQCFVRWGANDGPDDAFENFNRWPELHALGASDDILQLYLTAWNGMIRQYTEAKTTEVPIARGGMYHKDFCVQSDWMHHGEALQNFNRMGLSVPNLPIFRERARRFAGFYMAEDSEAPNYDPARKLVRSLINGSRGPLLREATALDWAGDPFDASGFVARHGESTYPQFLEHYREYTDVVGDHFLNLVATTLPTTAFLLTQEPKYKAWLVGYMDAWLGRMKRNRGIVPSHVALDGTIGGADGHWWKGAYGWGFSPVNPVNGRRENRNRIPRAVAGFNNALLVTGDQKYVDAWRAMIAAVNANARTIDGRTEYPTMYGERGWFGWQSQPWNEGAVDVWYGSMKPEDRRRVGANEWLAFLDGRDPAFPENALRRELESVARKVQQIRQDRTLPEKRLADNMLDQNPASTNALVQLMLGGMPAGREGGLLTTRLRYFDPKRQRAGVPEDVAALVTELSDTKTVVTLVNVSAREPRDVIVQGGAYGEHQVESVSLDSGRESTRISAPTFRVRLAPGAGATLTLQMRRYANRPSLRFPWDGR